MIVRKLKSDEGHFKEWVLNGFLEIRKIDKVIVSDSKREEIMNDLEWAVDENNTWRDILICLNEDKIVGYCWYLKQTIMPYGGNSYGDDDKPYIWIHSVYTDPSMGRKGVASLLYSRLEEIAKEEKVSKIYLDMFPQNVISEVFHYKHGFQKEIIIYSKKL